MTTSDSLYHFITNLPRDTALAFQIRAKAGSMAELRHSLDLSFVDLHPEAYDHDSTT
jgi:hypothetical protein